MTTGAAKICCGILAGWLLCAFPAGATVEVPFRKIEWGVKGRVRHVTLEPGLFHQKGRSIVVAEREGVYPDWTMRLSIWGWDSAKKAMGLKADIPLPTDTLFYGFAVNADHPTDLPLVLIRKNSVDLWNWDAGAGIPPAGRRIKISGAFDAIEEGDATPIRLFRSRAAAHDWLVPFPSAKGLELVSLGKGGLKKAPLPLMVPKAFYHSGVEGQALELPYWFRGSLWYPQPMPGRWPGFGDAIFWPWMDDVWITPAAGEKEGKAVRFRRFTEEERDDGLGYAVTLPDDLNGDGWTDFVVNKFMGSTTSLMGETTVFYSRPDGTVPAQGIRIAPQGNRAGGALVVDVDRDGKKDLVVASSQFNAWAVVRALLRKTVEVQFSFFLNRNNGLRLDQPDFHRDLSFRFSLTDAQIDGVLPSLDGDFNGDGLPDVAYAGDRNSISVLVQKKDAKEMFTSYPNATFQTPVPRRMELGDVDGDGRSDIVLYETRSSGALGNRKISLLWNTGGVK